MFGEFWPFSKAFTYNVLLRFFVGWRGYALSQRSGSWHHDTVFLCKPERKSERGIMQWNQHCDLQEPQSHIRWTYGPSHSTDCYFFEFGSPWSQRCNQKFQEKIRGELIDFSWWTSFKSPFQSAGIFVIGLHDPREVVSHWSATVPIWKSKLSWSSPYPFQLLQVI